MKENRWSRSHLVGRRSGSLFALAGAASSFLDITAIAQRGAATSRTRSVQQKPSQAELRKGEGRAVAAHVAGWGDDDASF